MRVRLTRSRLAALPGLLLAALALVGQLALGAAVLPDAPARSQAAELDALGVVCLAGAPAPRPGPAHHRRPDCALLALGAALAVPGALLLPAPALPEPGAGLVLHPAFAVSARGPPSHASHLGYPRGPPVVA